MGKPLAIGTSVRVLAPWSGSDEPSEPTTIAAVQYLTDDGEGTDEPSENWQYTLDGDEPFADCAFLPEYVEPV